MQFADESVQNKMAFYLLAPFNRHKRLCSSSNNSLADNNGGCRNVILKIDSEHSSSSYTSEDVFKTILRKQHSRRLTAAFK
jgi:hypothetical protein